MHLSAEQLAIASRIDAKMQRLADEGNDDVAIFVELADDMPAFRRLLDAGPHAMDQLCLRFGGFYRYAKILEPIAAGIGVLPTVVSPGAIWAQVEPGLESEALLANCALS